MDEFLNKVMQTEPLTKMRLWSSESVNKKGRGYFVHMQRDGQWLREADRDKAASCC